MAYHPCDLGPTLVVALDTEEVDVEVRVGLQVAGIHAREAPEVALDPGAEVVHERHRLQVGGVADIGLVALVHEAVLPDQHVVRPLTVVDEGGALRDVRPHRLPDPGGRGLAVPAYHRDGLLAGVDPDRDADLLPGEAALAGPPVAPRQVRVVYVRLVDPRAAPQHDAVLVAVDGGEGPVAPLPGGLAGDAAHLRAGVERHGEEREADEVDPGRKRLLAVLEDGPRERGEPRAAPRAAPPAHARRLEPVPPGRRLPAGRARGVRAVQLGGLGERPEAGLLPEPSLGNGGRQQVELAGGQAVDEPRVGVRALHGGVFPSARTPTRRELSPNKDPGGRSGTFSVWLGRL